MHSSVMRPWRQLPVSVRGARRAAKG